MGAIERATNENVIANADRETLAGWVEELRAENERLREELRQGRDYHAYIYTIQKRDAEIADLRAEVEQAAGCVAAGAYYQAYRFTITSRDAEIADLRAENARLREALKQILDCEDCPEKIARKALRQEGGE